MPSFKTFIQEKIDYLVSHFKKKAVLLDYDGSPMEKIDLSFDTLSDEYLQMEDQVEEHDQKTAPTSQSFLRITDHDIKPFLDSLSEQWSGKLSLADQDVTDQTILRLSQIIREGKCKLKGLNFTNNKRITFIGAIALAQALRDNCTVTKLIMKGTKLEREGANRLIELISLNKNIKEYDFGEICNDSLIYLSKHLENAHCVENIAFGQDLSKKWDSNGKKSFDQSLRKNPHNKQLNSITVYSERPQEHYTFLAELSILCSRNRQLRIKERENDHKSKSLNPQHPKYYDPDNHTVNAYKFSVKSYLTNVFGSMLDEGLYFLEKERRNSLRQQAIFNITKAPTNKAILQDICTADGSIMVLAQYLLKKLKSGGS